ncbi:MAG TPA: DNA internalization-related competence protein ComEC/Rec2 [Steroidobacteraceae bacterium]|nr:DNA internalization-related competence protein ComEC/Rec2 [Steroidobacteraceae bacterium]
MVAGLSLLAGVLLGLASTALPAPSWSLAAALMCLLALWSPVRRSPAVGCMAWSMLGLALASESARHWLELQISSPARDTRLLLDAVVASVPERDGAELRFDAEVRLLEGPGSHDGRLRHARLSWRDPAQPPQPGERWSLLARLAASQPARNFAGVDSARLAFRDRVHLQAEVLASALDYRVAAAAPSIDGLRARIARRVVERVADPDAAGLITALAVGLTAGVSRDQWRIFNATGTTHLVAISGLHVTLFAMLALWMARAAWRSLPGAQRLPREPCTLLLALAAAGAYALLAGMSVPTLRTWLMLAVFVVARLAARAVPGSRTWSLALVAVLLADAFAPLAAGFWLSFAAVGVIILVESSALVRAPGWQRALTLQWSIMLALAPLTLLVFGNVSLVGLAVNLVAIPVVSFVFVPLVLAGALLHGVFFAAAATLYAWLWPLMVWAADLDFAQWRIAVPDWWYALAVPAVWLMSCRWPPALRFTALAALLPLLFVPPRAPAPGELQVSALDTGRGSAVLLSTHSHRLLYDTGDSWNTHGTRLAQWVLPALDAVDAHDVDVLVLPALDADRAQAAALLASERRLHRVVVGGGWPATSLPVETCRDSHLNWDGVDLQFLSAGRHREYCVLRVSVGRFGVLLAGDLDAEAERGLVARLPDGALASELAFVPRQASARASSNQWIEASGARWAVASGGVAGSQSRAQALERWRRAGARVLDTRVDGGIDIGIGTQGITRLVTARSARHPFAWRRVD